jgi:DNA-binding NtrC family response regulator
VARILVIDDDEHIRAFLHAALSLAGHEVTETGCGAEGRHACESEPFDVVVCDIFMPEPDSMEFIRGVRTAPARPHLLAMSGGSTNYGIDLLPVAAAMGAEGTLRKPFTVDDLIDSVVALLHPRTESTPATRLHQTGMCGEP